MLPLSNALSEPQSTRDTSTSLFDDVHNAAEASKTLVERSTSHHNNVSQMTPTTPTSTVSDISSCKIAAGEALDVVEPEQPFHQTRLGKLAPELREQIFLNLLAIPPPYAGRQVSVPYHLKASHFAILRTCRQIYLEAFPIFYGRKSYYAANAQELVHLLQFGQSGQSSPEGFRSDKITTLCVRDLVSRSEALSIDELFREINRDKNALPPITFGTTTAGGVKCRRLDKNVFLTLFRFETWKSLQKICLCMRAGDEIFYIDVLLHMPAFERATLDFINDHTWTITTQPRDPPKLKNSVSYFEPLWAYFKGTDNLQGIYSERLELITKSRMSGLKTGNERYVEVDIVRHVPADPAMDSVLENEKSKSSALLYQKSYIGLGVGLAALVLAWYLGAFVLIKSAQNLTQ